MINLPAISERCLEHTLEGAWASDVRLIGPDGEIQEARGQFIGLPFVSGMDSRGVSHGGRDQMVDSSVSVSLRFSSLSPVPASGEPWIFVVPSVKGGDPDTPMYLEKAPEKVDAHGFGTFRLTKTKPLEF